jgi:hypothetical protein
VLDEIRTAAETARDELDNADRLVRQADEAAEQLECSSTDHGWAGLNRAMGLVREELDKVLAAIDAAHSATALGIGQLSEITAETSSNEVAVHLSQVRDRLDSARRELAALEDPIAAARDLAIQANAPVVDDPMDPTERGIAAADRSLEAAMSLAETELRAVASWGDPLGGGYVADVLGPGSAGDHANVRRDKALELRPAQLDTSTPFTEPAERATAVRLADDPRFAGRVFSAPPPPDPGYDWVDDLGRTYDAMGDGTKAKYLRLPSFTRSIDHHLNKGNDFTVIDLTGYSREQITAITNYVNTLPAEKQSTIVRVGF